MYFLVTDAANYRDIDVSDALSGSGIIAQLKKAQVKAVAALPDIVTSDGLLWPISRDPEFRLIRVCKEDEGISICAALSYTDTRALMLMQQTGLGVRQRLVLRATVVP
mgnify:CR=1 FL=1